MARIKGWIRKEKNYWVQDYTGPGYPQTVEIRKINNHVHVNYGVHDTMFYTMTEARKFAIKWMKAHPKG